MTPEEQLARVRAYYTERPRQPVVWPYLAAILALIVLAFAAGLLFGWFLGSAA